MLMFHCMFLVNPVSILAKYAKGILLMIFIYVCIIQVAFYYPSTLAYIFWTKTKVLY